LMNNYVACRDYILPDPARCASKMVDALPFTEVRAKPREIGVASILRDRPMGSAHFFIWSAIP
jgi:hypothetical protein